MTSKALAAYLDRIGWSVETTPTLDTLAGLVRAHMQAIPFENLDVLLGRPVSLDLDAIMTKLVHARRGGYCFEHATLFAHVLEELGFGGAAFGPRDARLQASRGRTAPYVLDRGSAGRRIRGRSGVRRAAAALAPVPLTDAGLDGPGGATHWMARDGDHWILRTLIAGEARDAWVSTLERDGPADFVVANHYTATHPASPFVNRLMASRRTVASA